MVLGSGAVGSVIVNLLAGQQSEDLILCGTKDAKIASRTVCDSERVRFIELDCNDVASLTKACAGCRIVINASLPQYNRQIMEACLIVGAHYQDMCIDVASPDAFDDQLAMARDFREAGLVGLMCTGVSPGITNVLVADAVQRLDVANDVVIYHHESQKSSRFVASWSTAVLMEQISSEPLVWRNDTLVKTPPLSEAEEVYLPGLKRRIVAYLTVGDEPVTLPRFLRVNNVSHKMGGHNLEEAVVLMRYGLFSDEAVAYPGGSVSLKQLLMSSLKPVPTLDEYSRLVEEGVLTSGEFSSYVVVTGKVNGRRASIRQSVLYPKMEQAQTVVPGSTYIAYPTAFSALAFTRLIPNLPHGVYTPETLSCAARKEVLGFIRGYGAKVFRHR